MKNIWSSFLIISISVTGISNAYGAGNKHLDKKANLSTSATKSVIFEPPIYIPANKRHQGLSRFDVLPFTDRKKGDPDRYRAQNPNYVKKENGNYYFLLTVKTETHFYDDNLKDAGVLTDSTVGVNLTQTKESKDDSGKTQKYFYVKDKGYVLNSSLVETNRDIKTGKWFLFPLKKGSHELVDGVGIVRGTIAAKEIKLNYGQQKMINGESYYYAFSTKIKSGNETIGASGWVKASAIEEGNDPGYSAEVVEKMQPPATSGDKFTAYQITGGDQTQPVDTGEKVSGKFKYGYTDEGGQFVSYKVLPEVSVEENVAATDYLKRSDNVINLGFNVAGVSNDTFRVDSKNPLTFYRSSDKDATAEIDLFQPKDAKNDGREIVGKMTFVYGYVKTPSGNQWGWIALDALKQIS